jgi:hypothetical protein
MPFLRNITSGLRSLFRKEQVERELHKELRAYQDMAAEEKMKDGMTSKEALRSVRLERGSLEVSKEIVRSGGRESFVETCWQDLARLRDINVTENSVVMRFQKRELKPYAEPAD